MRILPPLLTAMLASLLHISLLYSAEILAQNYEPAIEGYSPVSYFTENRAEIGNPEYSVEYEGYIYHLTSANQVHLFNANPEKYKPRYHYCAYSVSSGKRASLDPTNFKVVGDTLLLFHRSDKADGLALWNDSKKSDKELLDLADRQFRLVEF